MRILLLALLLGGCASAPWREPPPLRVGTSGDYAPFSVEGSGFDVEVAGRLAADLGRRVEFVPFRWPGLTAAVRANAFDVAMSGVTWRPQRAVIGYMTRAVASGGPCVIRAATGAPATPTPAAGSGMPAPATIGVNRGGILEAWTRGHFPGAEVVTVDDNRSLPALLASGRVEAITTDSFELPHFAAAGQTVVCVPRVDRKVYWVAPASAAALGPRLDAWIGAHEAWLAERRTAHFGEAGRRADADHLLDLLARRLALMPAVGRWKHARGLPIEDRDREAEVLERAMDRAAAVGLDRASTRRLFELQIELAKALQAPGPAVAGAPELDLHRELRPLLSRLGDRIVAALAEQVPLDAARLRAADAAPLEALLAPGDLRRLRAALLDLRPAP